LSDDIQWHQLLHPAEGCGKEGEPLWFPQVSGQVRAPLQARGGHPCREFGVGQGTVPRRCVEQNNFFNSVLSHCLEPGERVEADNVYVGHAYKIKCPNNDCNPAENLRMQGVARSCHEMLNGCLKNWGIQEKVYQHNITVHGTVFYTCAVITQLVIANSEPLFKVEYVDD
jgi:hypothetical protein